MKKFFYAYIFKIFIMALLVLAVSVGINSDASVVCLKGTASWYSEASPGIKPTTANMEIFDQNKMTCASWDFPFNTILEVKNLRNGRRVYVRVNDRGPAKRLYHEGRVIDLTQSAFRKIEELGEGLTEVAIRVIK